MKLSLSRARESCLVWMCWFLGTWLVLETGPLFLGIRFFNIPAHQLVGPYVALAAAPAVVGPFIYRINRRHTDPPKHRAHDMGIASAALIEFALTALCYSAVKLGLLSVNSGILNAIALWLLSGPVVYYAAYRTALAKTAHGHNQAG